MKKSITKTQRYAGMGIAALLMLIGSVLVYMQLTAENTIENNEVIYSYDAEGIVDYTVEVNPNMLYSQDTLPEGMNYVTEYVKAIQPKLAYRYTGNTEQLLSGSYTVEAELKAYYMLEEQKQTIWSKVDILVPQKTFEVATIEQLIEESVTIDLNKYNEFTKVVAETSKINAPVELNVVLKGNIQTTVGGKVVDEAIEVGITIPIQTTYFTITETGVQLNNQELTETIVQEIPPNKGIIIVGVSIALIGLLGIAGMLVMTVAVENKEDKERKRIQKIFDEHETRLVAVQTVEEEKYANVYEIIKIEDLIKVADECQLPILYEYRRELSKVKSLYVVTEDTLYRCIIERIQEDGEDQ